MTKQEKYNQKISKRDLEDNYKKKQKRNRKQMREFLEQDDDFREYLHHDINVTNTMDILKGVSEIHKPAEDVIEREEKPYLVQFKYTPKALIELMYKSDKTVYGEKTVNALSFKDARQKVLDMNIPGIRGIKVYMIN